MEKVSIFIDTENRVCALCPDNLYGCTGWEYVEVSKVTEKTGVTIEDMFERMTNLKGIPLYKYVGGYVETRSPEEIAEDEEKIPVMPEEATDADYQDALAGLGVNFGE